MDILTSTSQYMYIFMLAKSNAIKLVYSFQLLQHFRFWRPYWIFEENGYFMAILTLTSHYMYIFMLERSNAMKLGYSFQILYHFRFGRPF